MVTVIGLGFVGLTTALGLCELGQTVYGIETNPNIINNLSKGKTDFLEPFLPEKLNQYLNNNFFVNKSLSEAVKNSNAVFFCVGTPYGEGGNANLEFLFKAIEQVLSVINDKQFRTLVIKSTIPPSTTSAQIVPYVQSKGFNVPQQIGIATNPEFLREGHCWEDFINADRVVIGTEDTKSSAILSDIYHNSKCPVFSVSYNTSEFIKYLSNSSLACLISFANEMSIAADSIGNIDTKEAFEIVSLDSRWKTGSIKSYFYPGCGYGGYCLPKDTNAMYSKTKSHGYDCKILESVIKVNDSMPLYTAKKIASAVNFSKESLIGILGLSFNVGTDDIRDTPAAKIIKCLNEMGYTNILAFDPVSAEKFKAFYSDLKCIYANELDDFKKADVLALVTPWNEFKDIKSFGIKIVDCRYVLKD